MTRTPLRTTAAALVIVAFAAGAAVGGYGLASTLVAHPSAAPSAVTGPAAVRSLAARPAPVVTSAVPTADLSAAALVRALRAPLAASGLGRVVRAEVFDPADGRVLLDQGAGVPSAPASTAKLLTAAALLSVHSPQDRFTTTVRAGRDGEIVLVGGGDPTLSAAAPGARTRYAHAARISDLAAAVRRDGFRARRVVVDDSLFTGPSVSPAWAAEDVPSDYASPVTAVMADGGRDTPGAVVRSSAPDLAAGRALARQLGLKTSTVVRGRAPAAARVLATVRSATVSDLIAEMLQQSDNMIAECLGRQVALATRMPPSFVGGAAAIRATLRRSLDIDTGSGMVDASGLAARDRLTMATLVAVLRATTRQTGLRAILTGLPVAGWSGSLADRFLSSSSSAAAGLTRAKTGTLTGVSVLAGLVHVRSGRVLIFAFAAERAGATEAAEAALDAIVARLATCACSL